MECSKVEWESAVLEFMSDNNYTPMVKRMGIPDHFIQHGPVNALYSICGIDQTGIYNTLIHILNS